MGWIDGWMPLLIDGGRVDAWIAALDFLPFMMPNLEAKEPNS